jgi:hypothetical protein
MYEQLFADDALGNFIKTKQEQMVSEINNYQRELNSDINTLCEQLYEKYRLKIPNLEIDNISIDNHSEVKDGISVTFALPFEGDSTLFKHRPLQFHITPVYGTIVGKGIHLTYTRTDYNHEAMKAELNSDIEKIKEILGWVSNDIALYNETIKEVARQLIEFRKEKLLKDRQMIESLGFPIKTKKQEPF